MKVDTSCRMNAKPRLAHEVRDVVGVAGDEVVDADHGVAVGQEPVGEMRAEETRGAGDDDPHGPAPRPMDAYVKPSGLHLGRIVQVAAVDDHRRGASACLIRAKSGCRYSFQSVTTTSASAPSSAVVAVSA